MRKLALVLVLLSAFSLHAKSAFSGTYSIKGVNPGVGAYTGTLTITPRGDIYDVHWVIGTVRYDGIGVASGETLAVAYSGADHSFMGVVSYTKRPNGLDGRWAVFGGGTVPGTETATRK